MNKTITPAQYEALSSDEKGLWEEVWQWQDIYGQWGDIETDWKLKDYTDNSFNTRQIYRRKPTPESLKEVKTVEEAATRMAGDHTYAPFWRAGFIYGANWQSSHPDKKLTLENVYVVVNMVSAEIIGDIYLDKSAADKVTNSNKLGSYSTCTLKEHIGSLMTWFGVMQDYSDNISRAKAVEIFKWLLGYYDFPEPPTEGRAKYYWRTNLRDKLKEIGIEVDGTTSPFQSPEHTVFK